MHDLNTIRSAPEAFDAALARRGLPPRSQEILELDAHRRAFILETEQAQARRNEASKEIGQRKRTGETTDDLMAEVARLKEILPELEIRTKAAESSLDAVLNSLPNLPAPDVPEGADESANVERHRVGTPRAFDYPAREHFDLGEGLGMMDFEAAARLSGSRFVVLRSQIARLERALANFMLDLHTAEFGFTEMSVPYLVRDAAVYGTGQLPKFEEDLFRTTDGYWLIPTSEVPLTNLVADQIMSEEDLPLRFTAHTPCFRSEAGSAGRDTRGMIRLHQFSKVEMVVVTTPEQSDAEHERMLTAAETVLKRLDLPFRTVTLCTGDMGFAARKTYDIEVWLPGQNAYREISSISNCGDFQARRMKARCRKSGDKQIRHLHTLNGSGLAVGRALVAVLENHQQADGSIALPPVLHSYMGGLTKIEGVAA
ncbi:MAG: serine--tRNA ligase [Elstera sp.]